MPPSEVVVTLIESRFEDAITEVRKVRACPRSAFEIWVRARMNACVQVNLIVLFILSFFCNLGSDVK